MAWVAWLIAAAALGVAEYFTLTLAFGLLAAAALVAAIVAGLGGVVLLQVLAFAVTAAVGLLDRSADRETADDPYPVGAGGQLRAGREEGGGHRGGYRYAGTDQALRRGVVGAGARREPGDPGRGRWWMSWRSRARRRSCIPGTFCHELHC